MLHSILVKILKATIRLQYQQQISIFILASEYDHKVMM